MDFPVPRIEAVNDPGLGADAIRATHRFQLFSQLGEDTQNFGLMDRIAPPSRAQTSLGRDNAGGMSDQEHQQLEFLVGEFQLLASNLGLTGSKMDDEIASFDHSRGGF